MGLRAGLDWCGKSRPTRIRSPDRPARRQSMNRQNYVNSGKKSPETSSIIYSVTNKDMLSVIILPNIHGESLPEKCIDVYQKISLW